MTTVEKQNAVEEWLRSSHAYSVLDDAVYGALLTDTVQELLEDYGLEWTRENRQWFRRALDSALGEGF